MDNRNNELQELINESDRIPKRLDYIKTRTKAKAKGRRRAVFTSSLAGSIAALFLCFVLLVNTSTAFAQSVYNIPALRRLVESVSWTNSYQRAFDNDYAQYIGQKCISGNTELEVEYVIADKANLVLIMKFDRLDNEYKGKDMCINPEGLTDSETGDKLGCNVGVPSMSYKENERFTMSYSLEGGDKFYNSLAVELGLGIYDENKDHSKRVESFSFQLELEEKAQERVYKLNKPVDIGGQILYVDSVTVYPTCSKVSFRADAGNTEYIKKIELSITNEKGEVWTKESSLEATGSLMSDGLKEYYLGSDYFTSSEHLKLNIKSVCMLPKDMFRITLDLNNGTITDSNGVVPDMKIHSVEDKGEGLYIWIDCYNNYYLNPALGWYYWFSDDTKYEMEPSGSRDEENGHQMEYLRNLKKPQDGIIILERQQPAYKAEVNVQIPIR